MPILKGKQQPILELIPPGNDSQRAVLERIRSREYKPGNLTITRQGGKFFVSIAYTFQPQRPTFVPGRVMGIDLGIHYAVVAAWTDSLKREYWEGSDLRRMRENLLSRYREIQKTMTLRDARRGHGKGYKFKPLHTLRKRWEGYRRWWANRLANRVVDYALEGGAEAVALENLDLRKPTFFTYELKGQTLKFPIGYFLNILESKLRAKGIRVIRVNPAGTTKRCYKCRKEQDLSLDQREFKCPCGNTCPRDYNAARNIAQGGLDILRQER
ncbi:MAG: transposase [Dehalococcoidia bacterium]|nr:transposase [Dehalococcoidia bacterium]MDW8120642.1 transposase [Chloroflexota bacterium]